MSKSVVGVFRTHDEAASAVDRLLTSGFTRDDISVLMSDTTHGRHFAVKQKTKMAEGAASGGMLGGTLGAVAAGLTAVASVAIPGVGLLAAGPLVAALAGLGAGAAAGGLIGGLVGLGIPEHEAKLYEKEIREGGILVAADVRDSAHSDVARDIFDAAGAVKIRKA